jgi:chromosome partitioning protein
MKTQIVAIANQKGGVGKTCTTINLAYGLASRGKQVLILDFDPQGQAATALGLNTEPCVYYFLLMGTQDLNIVKQWIRFTGRENLWLMPGNKETSTAQLVMASQERSISYIRDLLKPLMRDGLDYIVCDTAPSLGGVQERALWAADLVIVPSATDFSSSDGVGKVIDTVRHLVEKGWGGSLLGILPTFYDDTRESRSTLTDLQEAFSDRVLTPIHRATILRECFADGKSIFEKSPDCRAAQEYASLVTRLLEVK